MKQKHIQDTNNGVKPLLNGHSSFCLKFAGVDVVTCRYMNTNGKKKRFLRLEMYITIVISQMGTKDKEKENLTYFWLPFLQPDGSL